MQTVRLLHLGDLHFSKDLPARLAADDRDPGISETLKQSTLHNSLRWVIRKAMELVGDDNQPSAVGLLLSGDLTDRGAVDLYELALDYLRDSLLLFDPNVWLPAQVHVVPGNHDLIRAESLPASLASSASGSLDKFAPFQAAWLARGYDPLPIGDYRSSEPAQIGANLSILSLNSCLWCGEIRRLPANLEPEFEPVLQFAGTTLEPRNVFRLQAEVIDSPAVSDDVVNRVCSWIAATPEKSLPIVLTHHNLIPQVVPHTRPYSELLNAGGLRSRLLRLQRPVVLCHGHIHEHAVESVSRPGGRPSLIVAVGAPPLEQGFNAVDVQFGEAGFPLGCIVRQFKLRTDGSVDASEPGDEIRVPLENTVNWEKRGTADILSLLPSIRADYERFSRVELRLKRRRIRMDIVRVREALKEAEWLGLIRIRNREDETHAWHVRRSVP